MHYFLGLEVWQKLGEIMLSQGKYAVEILKRFGMMDYKSISIDYADDDEFEAIR